VKSLVAVLLGAAAVAMAGWLCLAATAAGVAGLWLVSRERVESVADVTNTEPVAEPTVVIVRESGDSPTEPAGTALDDLPPPGDATDVEATDGEGDDLVPPVDYPDVPDLSDRAPLATTQHFRVFADDVGDPLLIDMVDRWSGELEDILELDMVRTGRGLADHAVSVLFARRYDARCPARGLASPLAEDPLVAVYVDEQTSDVQVRAVLAHEIAHHLTIDEEFVGDGVLTEGVANWVAQEQMLEWQGLSSWEEAVRSYLDDGSYVSITDDTALSPRGNESCIARRDRVYNARASFVGWLIEQVGLETVLHMPRVERRVQGEDGEVQTLVEPDYEAATGKTLAELEEEWLEWVREGSDGGH
jgi:hypothetical protein